MKKDQLFLSTIAPDAAEEARRHGLGLEIAEYCTAWNMDEQFESTHAAVTKELTGVGRRLLHAPFNELFPCAVDPKARELAALLPEGDAPVLVVGLGNRSLTADAVGPLALPHILVTRHMLQAMPEEFAGFSSVAALTTGVLAETGLESFELIAAVAEKLQPRCVIVLDALAAADQAERIKESV